jgi:hypothetical protein
MFNQINFGDEDTYLKSSYALTYTKFSTMPAEQTLNRLASEILAEIYLRTGHVHWQKSHRMYAISR